MVGAGLSREQDLSPRQYLCTNSPPRPLHPPTPSSPHSERSLSDAGSHASTEPYEPRPPTALNTRPPYSYSALIKQALTESPEKRMSFRDICRSIEARFEYYRIRKSPTATWKVSMSAHLSPST